MAREAWSSKWIRRASVGKCPSSSRIPNAGWSRGPVGSIAPRSSRPPRAPSRPPRRSGPPSGDRRQRSESIRGDGGAPVRSPDERADRRRTRRRFSAVQGAWVDPNRVRQSTEGASISFSFQTRAARPQRMAGINTPALKRNYGFWGKTATSIVLAVWSTNC